MGATLAGGVADLWRAARGPAALPARCRRILGWAAGSTTYYILTLYPYGADRFVDIPDIGPALLLGVTASEAKPLWASSWPIERICIAAGYALLAALQAAIPDPSPGAVLVLKNVPVVYTLQIPPGNTGPEVAEHPEEIDVEAAKAEKAAAEAALKNATGEEFDHQRAHLEAAVTRITAALRR